MTTCNGCLLDQKRRELGARLLVLDDQDHAGAVTLFELGAQPIDGQGAKREHDGKPVRFLAWLMSPGHACGRPPA